MTGLYVCGLSLSGEGNIDFEGQTGYQSFYKCVVAGSDGDVPSICIEMFGDNVFSVGRKIKVVITNGIGRENLFLFACRQFRR